MICQFHLPYGWAKALTPERYAEVRKIIPELEEDQTKCDAYRTYKGDLRQLIRAGIPIEVREEVTGSVIGSMTERLDRIEEILLSTRNRQLDNDGTLNSKCRVHIGGVGSLLIDEVELNTDLCTNILKEKLAEGWRILAVCVQPDQRRPDYILARTKGRPPISALASLDQGLDVGDLPF